MILNMVKKAVAVEIMTYFNRAENHLDLPTRQAFTKAREKIKYTAFEDFFEKSCELALIGDDLKKYKGFRIFAGDGTSFFVGDLKNESIRDYFGESTTIKGKAMCRLSGIVDVLNEFIVNAKVSGFDVGERALAIKQIQELKDIRDALYLFDRGYWSPELVREIHENCQKFVMRLPSSVANPVSTDKNGEIIPLRHCVFTLADGDREILVTNLTTDEVSDEELFSLYAKRWGIESKYLTLKARLEIDSFSGQSANIVLQDIFATLYISNLSSFMCHSADKEIEKKTAHKGNKYPQKSNRAFSISLLRERFVKIILIDDHLERNRELDRLMRAISANVVYIGKHKPKPRDKRKIKESRACKKYKSVL